MKRLFKILKVVFITLAIIALTLFLIVLIAWQDTEFGGEMNEESLAKAESSPQFIDGNFENTPPALPNSFSVTLKEMRGDQVRKPPELFPTGVPDISDSVGNGIKATWIGHATVYIEMNGKRIITDPMLSTAAFPVKFLAPERYNPPAIRLDELPAIDFATISHDHFDHLDMKTVMVLAENGTQFFVGLGIKAHLMEWGVPEAQINEMDWWESVTIDDFTIHCTPARHYSGRKWMDNSTLWTSWVVESQGQKIFHSGDSGYSPHFEQIGETFGQFDISFIKIGDYGIDEGWRDIHMITENSVNAARDLNTSLMFPIHWGTFQLSYHDWFEPINLAVMYAEERNVKLVTPKLGQTITYGDSIRNEMWWKSLEPR